MKYKELARVAVKAGWTITENREIYSLEKETEEAERRITIGKIYSKLIFINNDICRTEDFAVIKAAIELAETPLEDRYEEKKYYLRHRFLNDKTENYLNFFRIIPGLDLGNKKQYKEIQTQFTKREIEKIKKDCKTDLKDFEQIEVGE